MSLDAWLPISFTLPDGAQLGRVLFDGAGWQIVETRGEGRALLAADSLARRWQAAGLIDSGTLQSVEFGDLQLWSISSSPSQVLCPLSEPASPESKVAALAFAYAFKATRAIDAESGLQDALYVEKISRLLPTYSISSRTADEVVVGFWLTGGAGVPVTSFRRLHQSIGWLGESHLKDVVTAAGFGVQGLVLGNPLTAKPANVEGLGADASKDAQSVDVEPRRSEVFELAGRPELAAFFNEHVVDIVLNRERYQVLGVHFPSAVILHGPPGTGKTFAVDRLVDFLGWPSFRIDAASVASPYIHETSKKVAQVFERAMASAPCVLVIDEMEAFLADREMGTGHHRVEEVAEFLRLIPEAVQNDVLIIAMTNRIDMIDAAIQRRGRFDHVIKVDFARDVEVKALLDTLLSSLPRESDVDSSPFVRALAGRPLSDVAFVVREGARIAGRSGKERLDQASLIAALGSTPARDHDEGANRRRIGFT